MIIGFKNFYRHFLLKISSVRQMSSVNKIYIRREENADHFQVNFTFENTSLRVNKDFNFERSIEETVEAFLGRIKMNIDKIVSKKQKKKSKKIEKSENEDSTNVEELTIHLFSENEEVLKTKKCCDVFFDGSILEKLVMKILDTEYSFKYNVPWVTTVGLPKYSMSGFPLYPSRLKIYNGHRQHSRFIWYTSENYGKTWEKVGEGYIYLPKDEDVGKLIKLECHPGNGIEYGPPSSANLHGKIAQGPEDCPFSYRHFYTQTYTPSDRIVSYNILADMYAETEVAKTELFPYCARYALTLDYRKQLYLKEILGYKADIICLQEVDGKVFSYDLRLVLGSHGFEGEFTKKSEISEGVATFYSKDKFKLLDQKEVFFSEVIDKDPLFADIWEKVSKNEALATRFESRPTTFQILVLECLENPKERLVVGNTHLYFHPDADHIRLIQGGMAIRILEDTVTSIETQDRNLNVTFLFCGDFNSTPDSGIYQLMTTNYIPPDCIDWRSNKEEEVKGLELKHSFSVKSACGTPEFTNYTKGFSGCLDYIYFREGRISVDQVVPFPSEDVLKKHIALPSILCPSDHLALIVDFKWKDFCKN